VTVASHDERNAKSSGNYYRIPWGAGGPVDLGESSPAASVTTAPEATRLPLRRVTSICLCR
jgi:hypothetical protein